MELVPGVYEARFENKILVYSVPGKTPSFAWFDHFDKENNVSGLIFCLMPEDGSVLRIVETN